MTAPPRVSVLLPVGRARPSTARALDSLLTQTLADVEVLVIGHDDVRESFPALVGPTLASDPRVRTVARAAPGIVGALNAGLAAARAPLVARMDDDDVAYPERLDVQLRHLETHPEAGLVGARVRIVDASGSPDGVADGNRRYERWLNELVTPARIRECRLVENPLPHPTWLGTRALFERLGGWRDGDFPEDHDLVLRALAAGARPSKPEPVLLDWTDHPDRLTRTDPRYSPGAFVRLKAETVTRADAGLGLGPAGTNGDADAGARAGGRGVWLGGTGRAARLWCDALDARGAEVRGFVDLPRPGMRTRLRHRPVLANDAWLAERGRDLLITTVRRPEARAALERWCRDAGLVIDRDFVLGE